MIKNIIIDFKRTIYDPDSGKLLENSFDGLKFFKDKGLFVKLVGKGSEAEIVPILKQLGIDTFFDEICIDDNKEKFFGKVAEPYSWLVIGDRARKEILFGGQRGMKTLWLKSGKFEAEEPMADQKPPDYIASSWKEIIEVMKRA